MKINEVTEAGMETDPKHRSNYADTSARAMLANDGTVNAAS